MFSIISQWTQQQGGASALRNYAFAYDRSGQLTDTVVTDDSENVLKTWSWQIAELAKSRRAVGEGTAWNTGGNPAGNRLRESVDTASTYNTFNELNQLDQIGGSGTTLVEGIVDDVARKRGDGAPKVCPKGCFWRVPFGRQEQQPAIVTVNDEQAAMFALPDGDYRFRRTVPVEEGSNTITVEAMDASENVRTNVYTVQIGGVLKTLEFDLNGNLRYERDSNGVVLREFQWDARNRLIAIIDPAGGGTGGNHTTEFEYDGLDRRVRIIEKENGIEQSNVTFLWSGSEIIQRRAADAETVLRNYFDDGFTEGEASYFYAKDHLGSIREVIAADGVTIESRYEYTPWGVVTRTGGTGVESDFLYTGHLYHAESGLFLAQYRAYDPGTGRWLSRDPLGFVDGPNLYAYVGNDPINFWDPLGLTTWWNPFTYNKEDRRAFRRGAIEGAAAYADGIIPAWNPFANRGVYDPCDKTLQFSKAIGSVTRDVLITRGQMSLLKAGMPAQTWNQMSYGTRYIAAKGLPSALISASTSPAIGNTLGVVGMLAGTLMKYDTLMNVTDWANFDNSSFDFRPDSMKPCQ